MGAYRIDREGHIRSTTSSTAACCRRSPFPSQGKERAFVLSLFRGKSIRLSLPLLRGRRRAAPDEVGACVEIGSIESIAFFRHLFHRRLSSAVPLPLTGEGACVRPFPISEEEYSFVPSLTEGNAARSAG